MRRTRLPIVGRDSELAAVARFLSDAAAGPESLVLEGAAGIGKTAIWSEATAAAENDGLVVRATRCSESEAVWAFAGLGDLLEGLPEDVLAALPDVQQRALHAALLASDEPAGAGGSRVVGVAVLEVLRALSRTAPLILAIDDVQWLDASTRNVVTFALRRLVDEPVRLLTSCRTGGRTTAVDADLGLAGERLVVGPVTIGALQRITQTRLGTTLSRPTLTRLHLATGGNPMMCMEMARSLQRRGGDPAPGEPLSVPADLRSLVAERLQGLSRGAGQLLLFAAALGQPTVAAVSEALGEEVDAAAILREALSAGVVEVDGERIRFTHPLIASVPYADLTAAERRTLHTRLAATVTEPEEHARHSALGSADPSAEVAAALDVASRHARHRGSLDAAVELAELAVSRTPPGDPDAVLRRTIEVADCYFLLGDPARARAVLSQGLEAAEPGPLRVPGLLLQATIASWEQGDATVAALCEHALLEAGDDALLLARCHTTFAETCPSGAVIDLAHAESAIALMEAMDEPPPVLLASALTNMASHRFRLGQGLDVATLERAVALQGKGTAPPISERAEVSLGLFLKAVDRFDESRQWLTAMRVCAADEGDESALPIVLGHLAILECWAGRFPTALGHALEGRAMVTRLGIRSPMLASSYALVLGHQGRLDEARSVALQDFATDEALGYVSGLALHLRSLGFAELAAGDPAAAAEHLLKAWAISLDIGVGEPGIMRLHGDAIEALVTIGDLDQARRMTDELADSDGRNGTPWAATMVHRCRGLIAAAEGAMPAALVELEAALVHHLDLPMPFEEARTRYLFGRLLRRTGHRTDARQQLELALSSFEQLGAPVQAAQARTELSGISGRRAQDEELTAVEARVASLVREGRTNREVAAALFVSVRTVESHLGRIYRKRGVRSRTELAAMAD
ncbi:LuxR family transcriptional regulator [Acidothermaceae bacterium B102]|nr:LuxR family transcriptional regulator [Acidothermaceae bacterium B102]